MNENLPQEIACAWTDMETAVKDYWTNRDDLRMLPSNGREVRAAFYRLSVLLRDAKEPREKT